MFCFYFQLLIFVFELLFYDIFIWNQEPKHAWLRRNESLEPESSKLHRLFIESGRLKWARCRARCERSMRCLCWDYEHISQNSKKYHLYFFKYSLFGEKAAGHTQGTRPLLLRAWFPPPGMETEDQWSLLPCMCVVCVCVGVHIVCMCWHILIIFFCFVLK